ncbi:MAG: hypothetical protein V3S29_03850 [bacterium]
MTLPFSKPVLDFTREPGVRYRPARPGDRLFMAISEDSIGHGGGGGCSPCRAGVIAKFLGIGLPHDLVVLLRCGFP